MRRSSGSTVQNTRQSIPQVGPESGAWWESRLLPYRQFVLFLWSALIFSPTFLRGAAIWVILHILIMSVYQFSGSVLEGCGNLLVIVSILYTLLFLGLKYGNLTLFSTWTANCDQRFREICVLFAAVTVVLSTSVNGVVDSRRSNPKMFYGGGIALSFLLFHVGQWLSTVLLIHLLVSGLLLLPLVMERYKPQPEHLKDKLARMWVELKYLAHHLWLKVQQNFRTSRRPGNRQ